MQVLCLGTIGEITSTKDEDLGSPLDQLSWGDKMESSTDLIMFEGQLKMLTSGASRGGLMAQGE